MKKQSGLALLTALLLVLGGCAPASTAQPPQQAESQSAAPAVGGETVILGGRDAEGVNGVVATGREDATQIGVDILPRHQGRLWHDHSVPGDRGALSRRDGVSL